MTIETNPIATDDPTASSLPTWDESLDAITDFASNRPMSAVMASAAVGAGLVALASLLARDNGPRVRRAAAYADSRARDYADMGAQHYAELKWQLSDLAQKVAAALPSRREARRETAKVVDTTSNKASDAWNAVRDQALDVYDQVRPRVDAASDVVRANPVVTAMAVGVVGALIGWKLLSGESDHNA